MEKNTTQNERKGPIYFIEDQLSNHPKTYLIITFIILTIIFVCLLMQAFSSTENSNNLVTVLTVVYGFIATVVSVMFSKLSVDDEVDKKVSEKWLPNATQATKGLLNIADQITRLRYSQNIVCGNLDIHLEGVEDTLKEKIKNVVAMHCSNNDKHLHSLCSQINISVDTWQEFIGSNCSKGECDPALNSIYDMRIQLLNMLIQHNPERKNETLTACSYVEESKFEDIANSTS